MYDFVVQMCFWFLGVWKKCTISSYKCVFGAPKTHLYDEIVHFFQTPQNGQPQKHNNFVFLFQAPKNFVQKFTVGLFSCAWRSGWPPARSCTQTPTPRHPQVLHTRPSAPGRKSKRVCRSDSGPFGARWTLAYVRAARHRSRARPARMACAPLGVAPRSPGGACGRRLFLRAVASCAAPAPLGGPPVGCSASCAHLDRAPRKLGPRRPVELATAPSSCNDDRAVSGTSIVQLRQLSVPTHEVRTVVFLGCTSSFFGQQL